MLIQILTHNPGALTTIVANTPGWVGLLLLGLAALGISQMFARRASLLRVSLVPIAMTGLSVYGLVSAFAATRQLGPTLALWLTGAAASAGLALWWHPGVPAGTRFDAATRHFALPGSTVPMALILGIFLIKYIVGVELAMQAGLAHDTAFALGVASLYGAINGAFAARTLRLWRLTRPVSDATSGVRPMPS